VFLIIIIVTKMMTATKKKHLYTQQQYHGRRQKMQFSLKKNSNRKRQTPGSVFNHSESESEELAPLESSSICVHNSNYSEEGAQSAERGDFQVRFLCE
jgi:hypothetical protein